MPKPFADLKPALHQETVWMENMLPWLNKLDGTPISDQQVKAFDELAVESESLPPSLPPFEAH